MAGLRPPTNFQATALDSTTVKLAWEPAGGEMGFELERREPLGAAVWGYLTSASVGQSLYADVAVEPATAYEYRIRSRTPAAASEWVYSDAVMTPF